MPLTFTATGKNKIRKEPELNKTENLVNCEFFNTNIHQFQYPCKKRILS